MGSILIVEDDEISRAALVHILNRLGYHAIPAASVAEGLEKLDGQARAIVDLNLPDGLGTTILRRIREEGRPIRAAIATAKMDPAVGGEAEDCGAELMLRKPFDLDELLDWLKK